MCPWWWDKWNRGVFWLPVVPFTMEVSKYTLPVYWAIYVYMMDRVIPWLLFEWNHLTHLPGQNGRCFSSDTFNCIFMNEKFCILIQISLDFVPKGPINNKSALVHVMAWRQTGDKPLLEPRLDLVHRCIYAALGGDELKYVAKIYI